MKSLDHDTFHAMEIDALYEELDAPSSAAVRDHKASCESCASRFQRLHRARQRGLAALTEAVPENFESRIMAAVDAALAKRAGGPVLVPKQIGDASAPPHAPPGGAPAGRVPGKVIPFFSRPSFAVAATLVLVLGAAAFLSQMTMSRKSAPLASSPMDEAVAASGAAPAAPPVEVAVAAEATGTAPATKNEDQQGNTLLAFQEPASNAPGPRAAPHQPPSPPPMVAAASAPEAKAPAKATRRAGGPTGGSKADPAFSAALALYNAGSYAAALPRFEELKATHPEAELYAARCLQRTSGCPAAAPRFDVATRRNSGTEVGSRARLEAADCYQQMNQPQAARTRLQAAKDEGILASEAASDLEALDRKSNPAPAAAPPAATTGPGTPGAGKPSSPKQHLEDNSLH